MGVASIIIQLVDWSVLWSTIGPMYSTHRMHSISHLMTDIISAGIEQTYVDSMQTILWPLIPGPVFLYKSEQYNPNNPVKVLFRNDLLVQVRCHCGVPSSQHDFLTSHRPSNISSLPRAQPIPLMTLIKKKGLQWNHFWNIRRVWVRNAPEPMLLLSLGWSPSTLVRLHT